MSQPAMDSDLLEALRHPLRRRILRLMMTGDLLSPKELADGLKEPLSNVSYHIRVLRDFGVVELIDTAPVRGSMQHFYSPTIEEPWVLSFLGMAEDGGDDG